MKGTLYSRRAEAVKFAHRMLDMPSSVTNSEVKLALRRAMRSNRARPKQSHGLTHEILGRIFGLLAEFLPRESIERLLAAQIIAAHTMAMDRLQLASEPELTERQRNVAFDRAMRAQNMLARLTGQYDRRRARAIPPMEPKTIYRNGRDYIIFVDWVAESPEVSEDETEYALRQIASIFRNHPEMLEAVIELTKQPDKP